MTPAPAENAALYPPRRQAPPWVSIALLGGLLTLGYFPVLAALVRDWMYDDNVSHGFFVPLVAGYIAWQKREDLASIRWTRNWLGMAVVAGAALQLYVATLGVELFLARTAFVFSVAGSILFLGGFPALKMLAFPVGLLFFMIPIPAIIYNQITLPLQFLASGVAETVLTWFGIPVLRQGNILELPSQTLSVVEACSGIRSLLSLSFLSLVYGYFFESRIWLRAVLFLLTVPIAILTNAGRVTLSGLLSEVNQELATGVYHFAEGWVVFLSALLLLALAHRMILRAVEAGARRTSSLDAPEEV